MPLIKWTPSFLEQMNEFDDIFNHMAPLSTNLPNMYPALDIYQDDKNIIVEAQLAGVEPKNVELSVKNDVLILKGSIEKKTEIDEKNYYRKEIRSGNFNRSVALPATVIADKAEAIYENGVLKITIPKETKEISKEIKIKLPKKK